MNLDKSCSHPHYLDDKCICEKPVPNPQEDLENIKSEASIFWDKISEYLPKSIERSALGDEKIYRAFYQAYTEFRPHLLSSNTEIVARQTIDK